ncbi:unnamed protein product, partial [Meganyctiphanes norvegica]
MLKRKVKVIHKKIKDKKMTSAGDERKRRIVKHLIYESNKTQLIAYFYSASLQLLKQYVCLFQSKDPLIHKLNEKQLEMFVKFLACFIKTEYLQGKDATGLKNLDIVDNILLPKDQIFYGKHTETVMAKYSKGDSELEEFKINVETCYVNAGKYLQKKLPLNNPVLCAMSAIDPIARDNANSKASYYLKQLPKLAVNVLKPEEEDPYVMEVNGYMLDENLPATLSIRGTGDKPDQHVRVDKWWSEVRKTGKYPCLTKMVFAMLSCFHGPLVEASFNAMGDILGNKSFNMNLDTYNSYQTVQYYLKGHGTSAIKLFTRTDVLNGPIDMKMCKNIKSSASEYKKLQEEKREDREAKEVYHKKRDLESKKAYKKKTEKEENEAREAHINMQKQKYKKKQEKKI